MKEHLSKYWWYALLNSLVLGAAFIYLFLWKVPGVSYIIFFLAVVVNTLGVVALVESKRFTVKVSRAASLIVVGLMASAIFFYRLDEVVLFYAFLFVPVLQVVILSAVMHAGLVRRLSPFDILLLPFVIFGGFVSDIFYYLQNFQFGSTKKALKNRNLWRVVSGVLIALPLLVVFFILLSSADLAFAELTEDFVDNIVSFFFEDWDTFWSNVFKLIFGSFVTFFFTIFNFGLWVDDSYLHRILDSYNKARLNRKPVKSNWNHLTFNIVILLVNVLFATFVVVQFVYLFAGNENILGEEASFTYSEYVRRGFVELIAVAAIVFLLGWLFTVKVQLESVRERFFFQLNYTLLITFTLIMAVSAQMRIVLVESAYGFTDVRLFGHLVATSLMILLVVLLFALFARNARSISYSLFAVIVIAVGLIAFTPYDLVIGGLNVARYERTGEIDMIYLSSLSDEVVPVFYYLSQGDSEDVAQIALANLSVRWSDGFNYPCAYDIYDCDKDIDPYEDMYEYERPNWMSYNIFAEINRDLYDRSGVIEEDGPGSYDDNNEYFEKRLTPYYELLDADEEDKAYDEYWSSDSKQIDDEFPKGISLIDFKVNDVDFEYDPWIDFQWMRVNVTLKFDTPNYLPQCINTNEYMKIEDGEWKIIRSDSLPLGNFDDPGRSVYYEESSSFDLVEELTVPSNQGRVYYDYYGNCYGF